MECKYKEYPFLVRGRGTIHGLGEHSLFLASQRIRNEVLDWGVQILGLEAEVLGVDA